MRAAIERILLILALLTTSLSQIGCLEGHGCTVVGCGAAATILADVPADWARVQGARVRLCRNHVCWSGTMPADAERPPAGVGLGARLADERPDAGPESPVNVVFFSGEGVGELRAEWPQQGDERSGDLFELTVTAADGATLVSLSSTASSYQSSRPNGSDCEPTCHAVTFDQRRPRADR